MAQAHRAMDHATVALCQVTRMTVVEGQFFTRVMEMVKEGLELTLDTRRKECMLCRDRNINRYLPGGIHKCRAPPQDDNWNQLLEATGLCSECLLVVSDLRVRQHNNLTSGGLQGMRVLLYYETLKAICGGIPEMGSIEIPVELAHTLNHSLGSLDKNWD